MSNPVQHFAIAGFESVRDLFEHYLSSGVELGASFCVVREGKIIIDLWGGWADKARTRPWDHDTLVNVYSTTKTMTALVILMLSDSGAIRLDTPVHHFWPEFGNSGKEHVTVQHLLCHASGISGWMAPITGKDLYDWEKVTSLLASQAPFWEPGRAPGYHTLTQGYLLGEIVRRVSGASIGTFFRDEIAAPLGADFHIGLPASEDGRVAELIPPAPVPAAWRTPLQANAAENPGFDVAATRTRVWRGAEIPAAGGTGNARAIAMIQSILSNGGVAQGRRFLSEDTCRSIVRPQVEGLDLIRGVHACYGLGFGIMGDDLSLPTTSCFGWGGYGGSLVINDLDKRATLAFAMNKMSAITTGNRTAHTLIEETRRLLA